MGRVGESELRPGPSAAGPHARPVRVEHLPVALLLLPLVTPMSTLQAGGDGRAVRPLEKDIVGGTPAFVCPWTQHSKSS